MAVKLRITSGERVVPGAAGKAPLLSRRGVLALAAVLLLFAAFGFDALLYPWAFGFMRPITGTPALVGEWFGELTTPTGRRQWVALDLDAYLGRCRVRNCSRVQAVARVCDAAGSRDYEGEGHAQDWRGTRFDLELLANDERQEGLRIIKLQGERDGADLQAVTKFESGLSTATITVDRSGNVTRPVGDPDTRFPVNVILSRSSERDFDAACRRLSSQATGNFP